MIFQFKNAWGVALKECKGDRIMAKSAIIIAAAISIFIYFVIFYVLAWGIVSATASVFGVKLSFWLVFWIIVVANEFLGYGRYCYKQFEDGNNKDTN